MFMYGRMYAPLNLVISDFVILVIFHFDILSQSYDPNQYHSRAYRWRGLIAIREHALRERSNITRST